MYFFSLGGSQRNSITRRTESCISLNVSRVRRESAQCDLTRICSGRSSLINSRLSLVLGHGACACFATQALPVHSLLPPPEFTPPSSPSAERACCTDSFLPF